ncbi:hypothetical protein HK097_000043 [Rhizophlyctis rosea]|uniref:NmrA-like domain-containing protein n=1 Tax=Rhizophlyctis rosea TaxID=64517 RepID=A0AAD5SKM2_9FUNG|nr:hypothetical protein HK097_000043 [Rhizophlyctis rosea]
MSKRILVTGATGNQGGGVINALLSKTTDWKIYALTRNVNSASAQKLVTKGAGKVELVQGDLSDKKFLEGWLTADKNLDAVFSVQTFAGKGGVAEEVEQGKTLATLSQKAHIKHFIYTSVGGSNRSTGIPHFDSKYQIEEHIRSIALPYTILRPVFFMDNLKWPGMMGQVTAAFFKYQLREGRKLQMIAVRDIGELARIALEDPSKYLGKEIELAGDELTYAETNEIWKKHHNGQDIPVTYSFATTIVKLLSKEMRTMFEWFDRVGYSANIHELKALHPDLWDFDAYLQNDEKKVNESKDTAF